MGVILFFTMILGVLLVSTTLLVLTLWNWLKVRNDRLTAEIENQNLPLLKKDV